MHDVLTSAEALVLVTLSDTSRSRWWNLGRLEESLTGQLTRAQVLGAIGNLRRRQLVVPLYSGFTQRWSITTTGEATLANHQAAAA